MAMMSCPQCGNQISERAEVCPACGYQKVFSKGKPKVSVGASSVMIMIGCLLLVASIMIFTSSHYKNYQDSYGQYMEEYENALDMAHTYNRGNFYGALLYDGYEDLADDWKVMADNANKQLLTYRIAAGALVLGGCGLIFKGFANIKARKVGE